MMSELFCRFVRVASIRVLTLATSFVSSVAIAAPTVSITGPASNTVVTAPANVTINATASVSGATITKVEFFNGTTLIGTDTTSPYSFAWNNVAAGTYSLKAKATDSTGASTTSAAINLIVNARPTVSITAPAQNATFVPPASVTVSANAADSDGTISKVEFFNGTVLLNTDTASPYAFTWTNVASGTYSLTAKATDNRGDTTTSSAVSITVNSPPTVSLTAPANNAAFAAGAAIALSANASDADGSISKVEFFDGTTLIATDTTSPYSFSWTIASAGSHTLTAKATDNRGAVSTSGAVTVTVGTNTPPTVSITSPAANAVFAAPATIGISANAADTGGSITKVEFFSGVTLLGTDTTSPYSFSWTNVPIGAYTITAKATDNGGAATTSAPITVSVNANAAPTVGLTAPANNAAFAAPATIALTATAADSDGTVSKVEFFNGTTLLGTDTTSPYGFSWTNVPIGAYTLTAKATDDKGATITSVPVTVNVNSNVAPTVALTAPANNAVFSAPATIALAATASDSDGTISKVEFFNGATLLGTDTSAPYTFNWTSVPVGAYTVTAKATDNKGAVTTSAPVSINVLGISAPQVYRLTIPAQNSTWPSGQTIPVQGTASADGGDNRIVLMEYFNGTTLLGSVRPDGTSESWVFNWSNPSVGTHQIKARATDLFGLTGTSPTHTVSVVRTPPTVSFWTPRDSEVFIAPATVGLTAYAQDHDGVVLVEYFRGTTLIGSASTPPFKVLWANAPSGQHALTVKATDSLGDSATATVAISVANGPNQFPTVRITSPARGVSYAPDSTVPLAVDVSDADGQIVQVDYYYYFGDINGRVPNLISSSTTPPFSSSWPDVVDRGNFVPGEGYGYFLVARATDSRGAMAVSPPVFVSVSSQGLVPGRNNSPLVVLGTASNCALAAGSSLALQADAVDTDGTIARVEFYAEDVLAGTTSLIGTATAAPYSTSWVLPQTGAFRVTARATDNLGATTTSVPVAFAVGTPNNGPTVSIVQPLAGATFGASSSVPVALNVADPDGDPVTAELRFAYANGTVVTRTGLGNPYTLNFLPSQTGTITLTATACDSRGACASSAPVTFTILTTPAPTVSLIAPASAATYVSPALIMLAAQAASQNTTISKVEFFSGTTKIGEKSQPPSVQDPHTYAWINVPPGSYAITAKATDSTGVSNTSPPVNVTVSGASASLVGSVLFNRSTGTSIANDRVNVSGRIVAPLNTAIGVNGALASVDSNGNFFVNNVPLRSGANTITITINAFGAAPVTQTYTVNSIGLQDLALSVSPTEAFAPANFTVTVSNLNNIALDRVEIDANGDGASDLTLPGTSFVNGSASGQLTYFNAGQYTVTARAYSPAGALIYIGQVTLSATNPHDHAAKIKAILEQFRARLQAGDVAGASQFFTEGVRSYYQSRISLLGAEIGPIAGELATPVSVSVNGATAEAVIARTSAGVTRGFTIQFVRDGDGLWRIERL